MQRHKSDLIDRSWRNRVGSSAGIILAALPLLASCTSPAPEPATPDRAKADVALFLIRAGYDRWAAACAHALGKEGKTRDEAIARCTIEHSNSGLGHDEIVEKRLNDIRANAPS